jgi:hypothetical protein
MAGVGSINFTGPHPRRNATSGPSTTPRSSSWRGILVKKLIRVFQLNMKPFAVRNVPGHETVRVRNVIAHETVRGEECTHVSNHDGTTENRQSERYDSQ